MVILVLVLSYNMFNAICQQILERKVIITSVHIAGLFWSHSSTEDAWSSL